MIACLLIYRSEGWLASVKKMGKIAFYTWARLSPVFIKYFILNAFFRAYITVTPYAHYKKALTSVDGETASIHLARWIGRNTMITSRYVPGATCLSRAMTARWVLARKGYSAIIHIGVAKDAAAIKAHAWVTSGDHAVTGNENGEILHYDRITSDLKAPDQ